MPSFNPYDDALEGMSIDNLLMRRAMQDMDSDSSREMRLVLIEQQYKGEGVLTGASLLWLAAARDELESTTRLLAYSGDFKRAQRFQALLDKVLGELEKRKG